MFGLMKDGAWLAGSFGLLFVLFGLARTAANIGYPSFLLDLAPARERPLYIGLMNTLLGVATFLPAVGGLILDLTSFAFVFALTLLFSVCGLWLAWGLEEPRRKVQ
jgi:predicted MFS family arabinose efflux permease